MAKLKFLFSNAEVMDTASGKDSLSIVENLRPDIVFMDISMPEMNGVEVTRMILAKFPLQKIIGFSMNDNDETHNRMIKAGAKGYLLKTDDMEDYQAAIEDVLKDQVFISRNIMKKRPDV